jgi:uncharacterized HhH-GPD family protein
MAVAAPERLYFTNSDEANELLASDPLALLIGFALDQQVPVQTAFAGPLKIKERLGTLEIAHLDPMQVEAAFREKPAVHRFPARWRPGAGPRRSSREYGGDASRLWREASDADDLKKRISGLPGFGDMKVKALSAVLWKRFGVPAAEGLTPAHPTLGDVDSREKLDWYQAKKREHNAKMRAQAS